MSHSGSIHDRTTKYPLKCLYISTVSIKIIIMQFNKSMRQLKVKMLRKSITNENYTDPRKLTSQIIDSFILRFVMD